MLTHILDHLQGLNLEELRELNRNVCNALKGSHQKRAEAAAAKFAPGSNVLYCGKRFRIESVGARHLMVDGGQIVPISQCRPLK